MNIDNILNIGNYSKNTKDNLSLLDSRILYDIDDQGLINKSLENQAVVYIYIHVPSYNFNRKSRCYVGSTANLASRISSLRCHIFNWNKYKRTGGSPVFYKSVLKYGWNNFKFGILEYIGIPETSDIEQKKQIILEREQYFLDKINPSFNTYKVASSTLGAKRNSTLSINLSKTRRGKKSKKLGIKLNNKIKIVTSETKSKISLTNQGISVKIFDKSNNLINEFPSMRSAAKYLDVHHKTVSMIYKRGKSFDDFFYKFEIKENRIWVYDINHKLINTFNSGKKTCMFYDIPSSTFYNYIKSGKLYKNKYYFYNTKYRFDSG